MKGGGCVIGKGGDSGRSDGIVGLGNCWMDLHQIKYINICEYQM